jgi:hypothetical protein
MVRTILFAATLGLALGAPPAWGEAGPFGLTWGMSREEARGLPGLEVIREDEGEFFSAIVASRVPKELADAYSYGLLFSRRYGLVSVQWSSHLFPDDGRGEGARSRYAELKRLLEQSYGAPVSREFPWPVENWEPSRFYACVSDPSCGPYQSTWSAGAVSIRLEIRGEGESSGRLRLSYEHELLAAARRERGEGRGGGERDAL